MKYFSHIDSLYCSLFQITTSTAKKLWEKSDGGGKNGGNVGGAGGGAGGVGGGASAAGPLNPLHIGDPHVWKDSPWSTPGGDSMLTRPRNFPQPTDTNVNSGGNGVGGGSGSSAGNTGILR